MVAWGKLPQAWARWLAAGLAPGRGLNRRPLPYSDKATSPPRIRRLHNRISQDPSAANSCHQRAHRPAARRSGISGLSLPKVTACHFLNSTGRLFQGKMPTPECTGPPRGKLLPSAGPPTCGTARPGISGLSFPKVTACHFLNSTGRLFQGKTPTPECTRPQRSNVLPSAGSPTCGTAFWDQRPVISKGDGLSLPDLDGTPIPGPNASSCIRKKAPPVASGTVAFHPDNRPMLTPRNSAARAGRRGSPGSLWAGRRDSPAGSPPPRRAASSPRPRSRPLRPRHTCPVPAP